MRAVADDMIGKTVDNGEYRVVDRIGTGGMGSVYKAEQPSMNNMVAIKVLHAKFASRDDLVSRFRREARAMSQLTHPNTARVYKFGLLDDGSSYFVMDFLEGRNLAHAVRQDGPMAVNRALKIMVQVCGALHEAHEAGIIHRDLKPENIFLTEQGGTPDFPKVLDFGLAKVSDAQLGDGSMMLTQQGMVFGTPEFMSPEQTQGETLDRRSDIYALGLILFELLTGKLPFKAKKPLDMMKAHVKEPPMRLAERLAGVTFSEELEAVLQKSLAKKPNDRYADATEFGAALEACIGDDSQDQPPGRDRVKASDVPAVRPSGLHGGEPQGSLVLIGLGIGIAVAVVAAVVMKLL